MGIHIAPLYENGNKSIGQLYWPVKRLPRIIPLLQVCQLNRLCGRGGVHALTRFQNARHRRLFEQ